MTVGTQGPMTGMATGIDRKILPVMVERRRTPCSLCMALFTVGRELCSSMRRIGGLVVICLVTSVTGIRDVVVIAVMAYRTRQGCMSPGQHIVVVMDRESSRCPTRVGCMTGATGCRNADCSMVRICCGGIRCHMTSRTLIGRRIHIPVGMTAAARCGCMRTRERINIMIICTRCPARVGCMTQSAGRRKICSNVVRIRGSIIVG